MKYIKILFLIVLMPMLLSGCMSSPIEPYFFKTMYLRNYTDEKGQTFEPCYDTIKQEAFFPDDITIQYFEDKTFIFKEFDKEYTGTYTYINGLSKTYIFLTFSDGTKGNATCVKYMKGGAIWYISTTLQAFGKEYEFIDDLKFERNDDLYIRVGESICQSLKESKNIASLHYCSELVTLYKGNIKCLDDEYWFIPEDFSRIESQYLSKSKELYTYEISKDRVVNRGDNKLREGECFINFDGTFPDNMRYAVWYYDTYYQSLFPWVKELKQKDILSLTIESRNEFLDTDNVYLLDVAQQNKSNLANDRIERFYSFLQTRYILKDNDAVEKIARHKYVNLYTFIIKTTMGEFTMKFVDCGLEFFFYIDGEYYRDLMDFVDMDTRLINNLPYKSFYEKNATLYFNEFLDEGIKEYENFDFYFDEIEWSGSQKYRGVLKLGEEIIYLLDERHFLWTKENQVKPHVYEICGGKDFSEIFEEYPI